MHDFFGCAFEAFERSEMRLLCATAADASRLRACAAAVDAALWRGPTSLRAAWAWAWRVLETAPGASALSVSERRRSVRLFADTVNTASCSLTNPVTRDAACDARDLAAAAPPPETAPNEAPRAEPRPRPPRPPRPLCDEASDDCHGTHPGCAPWWRGCQNPLQPVVTSRARCVVSKLRVAVGWGVLTNISGNATAFAQLLTRPQSASVSQASNHSSTSWLRQGTTSHHFVLGARAVTCHAAQLCATQRNICAMQRNCVPCSACMQDSSPTSNVTPCAVTHPQALQCPIPTIAVTHTLPMSSLRC